MMTILKERPDLKKIAENLQAMLKEEAKLRDEFYNTIDEDDKAEFINGQVIMHSPVKLEHAEVSGSLFLLLRCYTMKNDLGGVFTEKIMVHLTRNSYEPDLVFFRKERAKQFTPNQMLFPAPDFIVEILSPSTAKIDRGIKFEDYALHQVAEYWIVDPATKSIEQYLLKNKTYVLEFKGKNGIITSKAITGFAINAKAAFNKTENIKAIQQLMK